MPVSVPKLQRIESSSPLPPNPRIRTTVQDQAGDILGRTKAITSVVQTGLDIHEKFENDKINQLTDEGNQDYTIQNNEKLQGLKNYKGDPTVAYADYEKEEQEMFDNIMSKHSEASERVRRNVQAGLEKTRSSQRIQVLKQRGAQQEIYKNNLFESAVKLEKNNLAINAGYVRADDPGSFLPFDQSLANIKTTISKRGLENGTVDQLPANAKSWSHMYQGADGEVIKVSMSDMAKQRTAKEMSEGVAGSIESMISAGHVEQSNAMLDKYKSYLDSDSLTTINKKLKTETTRVEAIKTNAQIETMPEDKRLDAINKIKNPEVKNEVLKLSATNTSRRKVKTKDRQDRNYDNMTKLMVAMKEEGKLNGKSDLEARPEYKAAWDKLSGKQQKAINEEFDAPTKSDDNVRVNVQDILLGRNPDMKVENMSSAQFEEQLAGLKETDKNKYRDKYFRMVNPEGNQPSLSESIRVSKIGGDYMKNQLLRNELIRTRSNGEIRDKDLKKLAKANDDLIEIFESDPPKTRKEINDTVNAYITEKTKEKYFGKTKSFLGIVWSSDDDEEVTPKVTEVKAGDKTVTVIGEPLKGLNKKEIFQYQKNYKNKFDTRIPVPTDPKFLNYVSEMRKR